MVNEALIEEWRKVKERAETEDSKYYRVSMLNDGSKIKYYKPSFCEWMARCGGTSYELIKGK